MAFGLLLDIATDFTPNSKVAFCGHGPNPVNWQKPQEHNILGLPSFHQECEIPGNQGDQRIRA